MNATATEQSFSETQAARDYSRRDQLITEHMPLVNAIASHVQRSLPVHIELDDLVHAGMMGLFDAASKYQDDKEVAFPTYAKHRIRGAILDSLRQSDWASRDLRKRQKQMESVTRDLTVKLQRTPTQNELAEAMGLDARRWQNLMVDFRNLNGAAAQARKDDREDRQPMEEAVSAPADCPDRVFARTQMRQKLNSALNTLPEKYQQVVMLYYEGDMSMKQIGSRLGVNESRVSQIHKIALERLHTALGSNGILSAAAF